MLRRYQHLLALAVLIAALAGAVLFLRLQSHRLLLGQPSLNPRVWLFQLTGEELPLPQIRGLMQWLWSWTRPRPETQPNAAVAYTDLPPFGVNTFLEQEVELEKREQSLQMIADAGFSWIRQSFPWYDIEIHGKGDFEDRRNEPYRSAWDKYDTIVDLAEAQGLSIIARLEHPPAWSRSDGNARGDFAPPDRVEDFGDYVEAVVTRYRGRIRFYQIWNEPNIYPEWGHQPVSPEAYTDLLCQTYQRIKAIDPEAVVISGALAQTIELGTWNTSDQGNNLMDVVFLQRMYAAGAGACFDIMAVNNYMLWSGPTDHRLSPYDVNFSRPMWVRDVMVANGDAGKPIWISEMNSNAAPSGVPDTYGRVSLEQQARYAPLAYERIQREWPWVGVTTVWFFKRASDAEQGQSWYYFRLVEPDFTPLPVYEALSGYLNRVEGTLYPGRHQATSWQLEYSGDWIDVSSPDATLGHYRRSTTPGATVTLRWEGRALILTPGPGEGVLRLTDEQGTSRELQLRGTPVRLAGSLLPSAHRITLTVVSGQVSMDELTVR